MVVRVISEDVRLPGQPSRGVRSRTIVRRAARSVVLFGLVILLSAGLSGGAVYVLLEAHSNVNSVPTLVDGAVEPALDRIDARVDEALQKLDQNVRASLQTVNTETGGVPSTDRPLEEQTRPWVLRRDGLRPIDSRDPAVGKTTEIHVGTDLSNEQVRAVADQVDAQLGPKLDALTANVDARLDLKLQEIAARHNMTDAQLAALKAELTQSVGVVLREEMARNQELWEDNATYRILFHRSLDLNQDLIGLYATSLKDDHALGNVVKVVPKLFTLQVWENKDSKNEYLRLLSRFEELSAEGAPPEPVSQGR